MKGKACARPPACLSQLEGFTLDTCIYTCVNYILLSVFFCFMPHYLELFPFSYFGLSIIVYHVSLYMFMKNTFLASCIMFTSQQMPIQRNS